MMLGISSSHLYQRHIRLPSFRHVRVDIVRRSGCSVVARPDYLGALPLWRIAFDCLEGHLSRCCTLIRFAKLDCEQIKHPRTRLLSLLRRSTGSNGKENTWTDYVHQATHPVSACAQYLVPDEATVSQSVPEFLMNLWLWVSRLLILVTVPSPECTWRHPQMLECAQC